MAQISQKKESRQRSLSPCPPCETSSKFASRVRVFGLIFGIGEPILCPVPVFVRRDDARKNHDSILITRKFDRYNMRFLKSSLALVLLAVSTAAAQETEPTPSATVPQSSPVPEEQNGQTGAPAPVPSPTPGEQEAPQLLPEQNVLPAQPTPAQPSEPVLPRDLIPEGPKPPFPGATPNPTSAEQLEKDKIRFRQLRTTALRDPYAIYFYRQANLEQTNEMKREYLRVYYITMCDEMRKLEPRLKTMIDAYENANIARLSQVLSRPTVPGRDIPRFRAAQKHVGGT
jgi:hypothetical protein